MENSEPQSQGSADTPLQDTARYKWLRSGLGNWHWTVRCVSRDEDGHITVLNGAEMDQAIDAVMEESDRPGAGSVGRATEEQSAAPVIETPRGLQDQGHGPYLCTKHNQTFFQYCSVCNLTPASTQSAPENPVWEWMHNEVKAHRSVCDCPTCRQFIEATAPPVAAPLLSEEETEI